VHFTNIGSQRKNLQGDYKQAVDLIVRGKRDRAVDKGHCRRDQVGTQEFKQGQKVQIHRASHNRPE